jgi:hypothetical protein
MSERGRLMVLVEALRAIRLQQKHPFKHSEKRLVNASTGWCSPDKLKLNLTDMS